MDKGIGVLNSYPLDTRSKKDMELLKTFSPCLKNENKNKLNPINMKGMMQDAMNNNRINNNRINNNPYLKKHY